MSIKPHSLHRSQLVDALTPDYVGQFRCVGPQCPDNCCTGWRVTIDKTTYKAYKALDKQHFPVALSTHLQRNANANNANYASVKLQPDSHQCPFMTGGMCAVQTHADESHLSDTCFSYPRSTQIFQGHHEQALSLSCPEAARLALGSDQPLQFTVTRVAVRHSTTGTRHAVWGLTTDVMNDIRTFCISVMQTTELELWERLTLLGIFCEALTDDLQFHRQQNIPGRLKDMTQLIESGQACASLHGLAPDHEFQAKLFGALWAIKNAQVPSATQSSVNQAVWEGICPDKNATQIDLEKIADAYASSITQLDEAIRAAPRIFDNYLLNDMFKDNFPFGGKTPYEHYLTLASRYGIIRFMIAAQCSSNHLPGRAQLIDTIQVFCRRFQHDSTFAEKVNQALISKQMSSLEKIVRLLKH